jgi:hypothetical protein
LLTLSITGCAGNPFIQFFKPTAYQPSKDTAVPSVDLPQVIMTDDRKKEAKTLFAQGYLPIGVSRWEGPKVNPDLALEQAKMVGAEIVAVEAKYLRTQSGAMPLGACPTLTVLLRRMICDHLHRSRPEKILNVSSEYTSGFSGPVASHLVAPLSPRHEGNVGQAPSLPSTTHSTTNFNVGKQYGTASTGMGPACVSS